jgi:hypothetical protein
VAIAQVVTGDRRDRRAEDVPRSLGSPARSPRESARRAPGLERRWNAATRRAHRVQEPSGREMKTETAGPKASPVVLGLGTDPRQPVRHEERIIHDHYPKPLGRR